MDIHNASPLGPHDRIENYGCYCWSCEQNVGPKEPRIIGTCGSCYDVIRPAVQHEATLVETAEHREMFKQLLDLLPCKVDKCKLPERDWPHARRKIHYIQLEVRILDGTTTMRFGVFDGRFFHNKYPDIYGRAWSSNEVGVLHTDGHAPGYWRGIQIQ